MTLKRDQTKEKIREYTLQLMDEGGLEAITARTLAKEVGISVGSLYNFFGNLDGLLEEVCATILQDFERHGTEYLQTGDQTWQVEISALLADESEQERELTIAFLKLADMYLNYVEQYDARWSAMLTFNRNRAEGAAESWYEQQQLALFGFVGDVLEKTPLTFDPQNQLIAARALWSGVHGIVSMGYLGQINPQARANTWAQIVLLVRYFVKGVMAK